MEIVALDARYRDAVTGFVREEWNGPLLVSAGKLLDARALPGFVAVEDGEAVAAALYHIAGGACEIAALVSYWEGRGIGGGLIAAVADAARRAGCGTLWLVTTNDNAHAIRFYQKRGFTLKAVRINAMEEARKLKPDIPLYGMDGIPLLHEFVFEMPLGETGQ